MFVYMDMFELFIEWSMVEIRGCSAAFKYLPQNNLSNAKMKKVNVNTHRFIENILFYFSLAGLLIQYSQKMVTIRK